MKDTYKEVRVFEFPNAIVRVHIPDITPEERERRMQEIKKAAISLLKSAGYGKERSTGNH